VRSPPSAFASAVSTSVLGCLKVHRAAVGLTFSTTAGVPSAFFIHDGSEGVRSLSRSTSLYQNTMSSAVNGAPSDQRDPGRSLIVHCRKSFDDSQPAAIFGSILPPSGECRTSAS
jgi:hypothetical protein